MKYTFNHEGKEYTLTEENLEYFANDEIAELEGIDPSKVLELLNNNKEIEFQNAYYEESCSNCNNGKEEKKKVFDFLEFYFYVYGKKNNYITSSIDDDYEGKSFTKLKRGKIVDKSYLTTVMVCKHCGTYAIEIEEIEL